MPPTILLNGKLYQPHPGDLPCLIHGWAGVGASEFTVTFLAHLYQGGAKLLFSSGFPMTQEKFTGYAGNDSHHSIKHITKIADLENASQYQTLLLAPGDTELATYVLANLADLPERIVALKNFELLPEEIIKLCLCLPQWILSGNVDECANPKLVLSTQRKTLIAFSPQNEPGYPIPTLLKYQGYLTNELTQGIVTLKH